jgi:hypothetical protein
MRLIPIAGLLASATWFLAPLGQIAEDDKAKKPKFTISKETTHITEPLDKDGYIDYVAALNKRLRQGITPKNNASVLLWKALGPHPDRVKMPAEFFRWMEIDAPPEQGEYFIGLTRYLREHFELEANERREIVIDQWDRATRRPWTPKQYPHLAAWLKANEKPLGIVIEASKRTRYYSPMAPRKSKKGVSSGLMGAGHSELPALRESTQALTARAMLRVGEGKLDDAWQDLLACHRLGRLVAQGSTIIDSLIGYAFDSCAYNADIALLANGRMTAKRLKECLQEVQEFPPMPALADKMDLGERLQLLDGFLLLARGDIDLEVLHVITGDTLDWSDPIVKRSFRDIDWDPVLRDTNHWYDRVGAALRLKDRAERVKKTDRLAAELKKLTQDLADKPDLAKQLQGKNAAKTIAKVISDSWFSTVFAAILKMQQHADRIGQQHANLQVAFALAAYQRDHGNYPKKLDDLTPKYLAKIPQDLFTGKALVYRPNEKGYLLYSFGVNGKDDEGRGPGDDPPGDDLSVRMPLPELPKK